MKRVIYLFVISLVLFFVTLEAYPSTDSLKIGVVIPLTGEHARAGEIEKNSFLLAMDEINRTGGIKGKKVSLIIEDDNSQPDLARSAAEKLISEDGVLVLTGASTETVWEIAAVAQEKKVPFLITSAAADGITEQGWENVFRICPPLSQYFGALMSFLETVGKPADAGSGVTRIRFSVGKPRNNWQ